MIKGFSIICEKCGEKITIDNLFQKEHDKSNVSFSVTGSYPFYYLYLYCIKCENEIEIEI